MLNYIAFLLSPLGVEFIFILANKKSLNNDEKLRKGFMIIMGIILFIMLGFKSVKVGSGDARFYFENWNYMSQVPLKQLWNVLQKTDLEYGYQVTVWVLSHIFVWQQFLFIISGAFMAFAICRFLYLNVRDLCFGFVLFSTLGLFGFLVQGLRQGIAICFCLLAVESAKKRKIISFFLLIVIAMGFHATAFVFSAVYFLPILKMNIRSYLVFAAATAVVFFALDRIYTIGNSIINDTYAIGDTKRSAGGFVTLAIYLLIIAAAILFADKEEDHLNLFFFMTLIGCITFIMRYTATSIMQRVAYYFMIAQTVLASSSLTRIKDRQRYIIRTGIILLCLAYAIYETNGSNIIPYTFFWQG